MKTRPNLKQYEPNQQTLLNKNKKWISGDKTAYQVWRVNICIALTLRNKRNATQL